MGDVVVMATKRLESVGGFFESKDGHRVLLRRDHRNLETFVFLQADDGMANGVRLCELDRLIDGLQRAKSFAESRGW